MGKIKNKRRKEKARRRQFSVEKNSAHHHLSGTIYTASRRASDGLVNFSVKNMRARRIK